MICWMRLKKMVGVSMGMVIFQNCWNLDAPSSEADSYREMGICFRPERNTSIQEPNCHTPISTMTSRAVLGLPSREYFCSMPRADSRLMNTPLLPNTCFHTTETAMEPPTMEGM